jgi:hypothetical protein
VPTHCDNARAKLKEVRFFLALMDRVEMKHEPLIPEFTAEEEFTLLLSGFLNACYTVTEYLKLDQQLRAAVKGFRHKHADFYASGPTGGWRTRAVHFVPVKPSRDGYIAPPGHNVILRFRGEHYSPPAGNRVNFDFAVSGAYYFTEQTPQNSICDLCAQHSAALASFVTSVCR